MAPDPAEGNGSADVDESLYSRQLYVMGHEAQVRYPLTLWNYFTARYCIRTLLLCLFDVA